ncbi:MAG: hypothetical protein IJ086_04585 [Clostridium sp.]|nr:hypothetical protein [Clostridium sp.]
MARREIKDLWESNSKRLEFLDNNNITENNYEKSLPKGAYESIANKDRIHLTLKSMHDVLFQFLIKKYKLAGSHYDYGDISEFMVEESNQGFVEADSEYEPEIDFKYTELLDLVLEDKNANETLEKFEKRLLEGDINAINDGVEDSDAGIVSIIQDIINFKLLLYMLCKVNETSTQYTNKGEFQLEEYSLIMSGNKDFYLEPRNIPMIHKINTLFINNIKLNKFYDLCNLYFNHLDEELRMFNIRQEKITLKTKKTIFYEVKNENGEKETVEKEVIEDTERVLNIISLKEKSLFYYNLSAGMQFEKIINNPWYYEYKPNIYSNIITTKDMNEKYIPSKRVKDYTEKELKKARQIKEIFSKEHIEAGHNWVMTEAIEYHQKRKVKNPIRNCNGYIEIDTIRSSRSLDKKLRKNGYPQKAIWEDVRSKTASVNKIDYLATNDAQRLTPVNVLNFDLIENILGLLGAGKSTFSMIAANDIIDRGGLVTFLVNDVESALDLASQYRQIGVSPIVFKGDSSSENQMFSIMNNKLKSSDNIFGLFTKERENLKILSPNSQSKAELSRVLQNEEDGRTSDTILIKDQKGIYRQYINPEVKDSEIYSKLRDIKGAQVIIINYSAYTKTKIPASLDIFERDFFTAIHLISDVIFIDEVDLAQSKLTEEYISDVAIASSTPEGSYTNNYLEIMTPYVNKVNKEYTFLKTVWDQSQCATGLFNIQKNLNYKEITRSPFDIYSLLTDIFERYINVDPRTIFRLKQFHRLERLSIKAPRIIPDKKPAYDYEMLFYKIIIEMRDPSFDIIGKKNRIRKKIAEFINTFIREEGLYPKKALYVNPVMEESDDQEQLEIKIENTKVDLDKYLNGTKISDAAFVRLLFFFEFCIFNKNQINLNHETVGFLVRNEKSGRIPDELGRLPIRPNPGIYPYAPKALVKNSHSYTLKKDRDSTQSLKIKMKEYKLIGDRILTESNTFYEGIESTPMPTIIMMSATSYLPTSSMYHNKHVPNYLIKNAQQTDMKINCRFIPIYNGEKLAFVSTEKENNKKQSLKSMIRELTKEGGLFDQQLERSQIEYEEAKKAYEEANPGKEYSGRKRIIGLPVTSFKLVYTIKELLNETRFGKKTIAQYRAGDENEDGTKDFFKDVNFDEYITKESVGDLYKEDCEVFIFVMSSVGRGYNILQSDNSFESLIGSMFFLVRPYLTAENFADSIYTLHSMQKSIIESSKQKFALNNYTPVSEIYKNIVGVCHATYNRLVGRNIIWSKLNYKERSSIASNYLVLLYQTIGRGLRGGTDLDIFFVDASFIGAKTRENILEKGIGENYSYTPLDGEYDSYLSLFEKISNSDDFLISELYSKLGEGLKGIAIQK